MQTKETKQKIIKEHQNGAKDTGSSEVQIALLTDRINTLTEHMKTNKKDNSAGYGLTKLVGQRKRLLNYIKRRSEERYQNLIKKLGLRK